MKRTLLYISGCIAALLALATSCHKPQFIESNADRQGLSSLTVIFTSGKYTDMELTKYVIPEDVYNDGYFEIPIPYYYPVTSDDQTKDYMFELKVQAELQPNFRISPALGILDLTEENSFTLTNPKGESRPIVITGKRVKPADCELVTFTITDMMVSCIIYNDQKKILVPYLGDLSEVSVEGQVSPHATLSKIGGKAYTATGKFNLNSGTTVTVLAGDGKTEGVYKVEQGLPDKLDQGLNKNSFSPLFNLDPVALLGFPAYTEKAYVSIASLESYLVVSFGNDQAPVYVNRFNGAKVGNVVLGSAKADVITNDGAEHLVFASYAEGGDYRGEISIWQTSSVKTAPTLVHSFTNPIDVPLGHRMKVFGDITGDAVVTFTAEGVAGVTTTAKAVVLYIKGGVAAGDPVIVDFASLGFGWGDAPVHFATVVPASMTPEQDGWYLDYYENNADADGNYLLHYVDGKMTDTVADCIGNWANNPNCLDSKEFNNARYMTLFVVSHFPNWGTAPQLYLYDITSADSPSLVASNPDIAWYQKGDYNGEVGAAGDVVLAPTADGYRMYIYYYDHHAHSIGGYVVDCIKK